MIRRPPRSTPKPSSAASDVYKRQQWNAAFDAGMAAALGKPLVVLHQEEHAHALKEVDGAALAVAERPAQVVEILDYVINGVLPG